MLQPQHSLSLTPSSIRLLAKGFNSHNKGKLLEAFRNLLKVSNTGNSSSTVNNYIASSSLPLIGLTVTMIEMLIDRNSTATNQTLATSLARSSKSYLLYDVRLYRLLALQARQVRQRRRQTIVHLKLDQAKVEDVFHQRFGYAQSFQTSELIDVKNLIVAAANKRKTGDHAIIELALCGSLVI